MKLVTVRFFSRLPHRRCRFAFAGLWIPFFLGSTMRADPLEPQAKLAKLGILFK